MTQAPRPPAADPATTDNAEVVIHPPVLWVLLVAVGLGLNWVAPLAFLPATLPLPWLGAAIWLAGVILAAVAVIQFRRAGTDVQVHTPTVAIVDTGVFAVSRNPIYVGAHIALVGVAVGVNSLWVLAMLIPFYLIIRHGVVAREERYLETKFGDAYVAYKARVRRWL